MELSRHYELVYIVRTDVGDDVLTKIRERIDGIVETHKGKVIKFENWGKRKLAYEIDKNPKGVYHYYQFYSDANCVAEIQRNLKINDAILKYRSVLLDPDADPEQLAAAAAAAGPSQRPTIQDSESDLESGRERRPERERRREDDDDDDDADDDD
jgi:small subunit ribosomal protein S6